MVAPRGVISAAAMSDAVPPERKAHLQLLGGRVWLEVAVV